MSQLPGRYRNRQANGAPPSLLIRMGTEKRSERPNVAPADPAASSPGPARSPAAAPAKLTVPVDLPTQPVKIVLDLDATVANMMDKLLAQHRHEMGGSNDVIIWEVANQVRRPVRLIEKVKAVMDTWRLDSGSRYCFETSLGDVRYDAHSLASLIPRRDMLKSPPELRNLIVHFSVPRSRSMSPSEWSLCLLNLRNGTVSITQRSHTNSQLKYSRTLQISTIDIYELTKNVGPAKHTFALRSCLPRSYFIDSSDSIVFISLDSDPDYSVLRNVVYTLRSTAIEHPHGLIMSSNSVNLVSGPPSGSSSRESTPAVLSRASSLRKPLMAALDFDHDARIAPTGMLGQRYDARAYQMRAQSDSPDLALARPGIDPKSLVGQLKGTSMEDLPQRGLIQRVKSTTRR